MSELEELLQRETALAIYESTGFFSLALAEAVPFYMGGLIGGLGGFFGLKATIETVHRLRNDRLQQGLKELIQPPPTESRSED